VETVDESATVLGALPFWGSATGLARQRGGAARSSPPLGSSRSSSFAAVSCRSNAYGAAGSFGGAGGCFMIDAEAG
jgi:hypothetical protein